jgi:hypothetical protein
MEIDTRYEVERERLPRARYHYITTSQRSPIPLMRLPLRSLLDAGLQHPGSVGSVQLQGSGSSPDAFVQVEGLGYAVRLDGQIVAINSSPIVALRPPATWWRFACPHCARSCILLYRLDEHAQPWRCRVCAGLKRRRPPPSIAALMRAEKALTALRAVPAERQPYERGRAWLKRLADTELAVKRLEREVARSLASRRR